MAEEYLILISKDTIFEDFSKYDLLTKAKKLSCALWCMEKQTRRYLFMKEKLYTKTSRNQKTIYNKRCRPYIFNYISQRKGIWTCDKLVQTLPVRQLIIILFIAPRFYPFLNQIPHNITQSDSKSKRERHNNPAEYYKKTDRNNRVSDTDILKNNTECNYS